MRKGFFGAVMTSLLVTAALAAPAIADEPVVRIGIVVDGPWSMNSMIQQLTVDEVTALTEGEEFAEQQIARAAEGREIICDALAGSNRVRFARPEGALLRSLARQAAGLLA